MTVRPGEARRSAFSRRIALLAAVVTVLAVLATGVLVARRLARPDQGAVRRLRAWIDAPQLFQERRLDAGSRCGDAPMLLPTSGMVGWVWDDRFRPGHRHTGLDIFSPDGQLGVTPIVAAYDGLLTREADWKSTVIIRHPDFPTGAGMGTDTEMGLGLVDGDESIWTYYTHMASVDGATSYIDEAFPPGTYDAPVAAGKLLGYQGRWSGDPAAPTGLHLHFSIVRSAPGGGYADETVIENTFDPIPFLGLTRDGEGVPVCAR